MSQLLTKRITVVLQTVSFSGHNDLRHILLCCGARKCRLSYIERLQNTEVRFSHLVGEGGAQVKIQRQGLIHFVRPNHRTKTQLVIETLTNDPLSEE